MAPRHSARAFCAALALVAAAAAPAGAYVRTATSSGAPMYWNRTIMDIVAYVGDPPASMSASEVMNAVTAAAATWSRGQVGCTSLELRVTSNPGESAPVELDGVSRLTFRRVDWCKEPRALDEPCYDPQAMAVTSVFARRSDGEILDADVEINAVGSTWSDLVRRPDDRAYSQDLQNTLTHEFGHFIGMDHTCVLSGERAGLVDDRGVMVPSCSRAPDAIKDTTMFAVVGMGDLDRRSLTDDDMNAVCDVYPPLDPVLLAETSGCAMGGRGLPAGGLGAALAGLLIGAVRRRRRARPPRPATRSSIDRPLPR